MSFETHRLSSVAINGPRLRSGTGCLGDVGTSTPLGDRTSALLGDRTSTPLGDRTSALLGDHRRRPSGAEVIISFELPGL